MMKSNRAHLLSCMFMLAAACEDQTDDRAQMDEPAGLDEWLDEDRQPERAGVPAELVADIDEPTAGTPGLVPGEPVELEQAVPINLVFIGYEPEQVDAATVMAGLPETYVPRSRFPGSYGTGRPLGVSFDFDYEAYYADAAFEDALFAHLQLIGEEGDATLFQQLYNDQASNLVDIEGPVLYIDGASAESWLASHHQEVVPSERNPGYTVYFINWYGRADFRHHVYGRPGQADPDTGFAFGDQQSRQVIGWGGSHHRGWFLDLSAGPEAWTSNWVVDATDVDGDGLEDYRLPPAWEYAEGGYRSPDALAEDLGLVTRFVAINELFTPSPIFDPMVTAPGVGGRKVVHLEVLEDDGDPAVNGADVLDPELVHDTLAAFQPYHGWETVLEVTDPIDADAQQALRIFAGLDDSDGCWNAYGSPFVQLSCYFLTNVDQYVPAYGEQDSVAEVFAFNTTDENMGPLLGILGFADDNLVDGTQTHVYEFATPSTVAFGYGLTGTTIHELGHHYGLSHPHDGYDPELDLDYGPEAGFYFTWLGSHSDTIMHYLDLSDGFGVFNRDTTYRLETAGYLALATQSLELIESWKVEHGTPWWLPLLEHSANHWAKRARKKLDQWKHLEAAAAARIAHSVLLVTRESLGIAPPAVSMIVEPAPHAPMTCGVRMPGV